ncbi:nucleotidyltransferase family protein [Iamia sp.]|uniref:nucleotidyltransferase family protein n=1 Tax=Iamia sp. TaxID=2722710 RepID=UPI002C588C0D|nr:nucleotidyltransferase family protein [Iamia sp.]HXH59074.1 nucleotidyltransferase family protein [Iamia sp.]
MILAAGAGSRFAGPTSKLLARLPDGSTVVDRALGAAVRSGCAPVAVVVGALRPDDLGPLPDGVQVVVNARWADGQATSLLAAVAWGRGQDAPALTIGLGDQPGLSPTAWRAVASTTATPIAVATYAGRRGHPVRLAAEIWDGLPVTGDEGARALIRARPELVTEVACDGDPTDIDTIGDLTAWTARSDRS